MTDFAELIMTTRSDGIRRGKDDLKSLITTGKQAEAAVGDFGTKSGRTFDSVGVAAAKAAGLIAGFVISTQALAQSSAYARSFGQALSQTSTLIEGTPAQLAELEAAARSFAKTYGTDATAQMQGFYQALSAGITNIEDATTLLDAANRLALGGVTRVATAVDVLTTAVAIYGATGLTAAAASDALFIGNAKGKTSVDELASSIGRVLPLAQAMGLSFDEAVAAVSALTNGGLATAEAVTGLRAMLAGLSHPTQQAAELANGLGLEFSSAALEAKGLGAFIEDLVAKTGGSSDALVTLFGSVEGVIAAMTLAGPAGKDYTKIMEEMGVKVGATDEAFGKMSEGVDARWNRAMMQAKDLLLSVGGAVNSVLLPALEGGASVIGFITDNTELFGSALGVLALTQLPALVTASVSAIAYLGTMEGLFVAGAAASIAMSRAVGILNGALTLLGGPVGIAVAAMAAGMVLIETMPTPAREATRAVDQYTEAQILLNEALNLYATDKGPAAAAALKEATQNYREAALAALEQVNAQVEAQQAAEAMTGQAAGTGFWDGLFGFEQPDTEAMTRAVELQRQLAVEFMRADGWAMAIEQHVAETADATGAAAGAAGDLASKTGSARSVYQQLGDIGVWVQQGYLASGRAASKVKDETKASAAAAYDLASGLGVAAGQAAGLSALLHSIPGALAGMQADIAGNVAGLANLEAGGTAATAAIASYRAELEAQAGPLEAMQDGQRAFVTENIDALVATKEQQLATNEAYQAAVVELNQMASAGGGAGDKIVKEMTEAEKAAEDFASQMNSSFEGVVQDSMSYMVNGFEDGFAGLFDILVNSIADMVAYAAANQIMVSIGSSVAGSAAGAAVGGAVASTGLAAALAPIALPLAIGAAIFGMFSANAKKQKEEEARLTEVLEAYNSAAEMLGWTIMDLSAESKNAADAIVGLYGSLEDFTEATTFYFANILSQDEQLKALAADFAEELSTLGIAAEDVPETTDDFQALVDTFQAAGDNEAVAKLMQLAPEFVEILKLQEQTAEAIADTTDALAALSDESRYRTAFDYQKAMALGPKEADTVYVPDRGAVPGVDVSEPGATDYASDWSTILEELRRLRSEVTTSNGYFKTWSGSGIKTRT